MVSDHAYLNAHARSRRAVRTGHADMQIRLTETLDASARGLKQFVVRGLFRGHNEGSCRRSRRPRTVVFGQSRLHGPGLVPRLIAHVYAAADTPEHGSTAYGMCLVVEQGLDGPAVLIEIKAFGL